MRIVLFSFLILSSLSYAQNERVTGKVISDFGWTYKVDNPDIPTDIENEFKVLFDVSTAPEDASQINTLLNTVARFLNMHVDAGKPRSQLNVKVVMHGNASYSLLKNEFYKEKFGVGNPNLGLLNALANAGVEIILCGQTAMHRDLSPQRRIPGITLALSTMTALVQLDREGFTIINFN